MIRIGIDTSVLVGLLDAKDKWHTRALNVLQSIQKRQTVVAIFDCVMAEAISTIARRMQEQRRTIEFTQAITRLSSQDMYDRIVWVLPDVPKFYTEVLGLVQTSHGQINFNDALIALACRERDIPYLASFDQDFDHIPWLTRVASPDDLNAMPLE